MGLVLSTDGGDTQQRLVNSVDGGIRRQKFSPSQLSVAMFVVASVALATEGVAAVPVEEVVAAAIGG